MYYIKEEFMNPTARRLLHVIRERKYRYHDPIPIIKHYVHAQNKYTNINYFKKCIAEDVPCLAEPCLFEMYMSTFYDQSWKLPVESGLSCVVCRLLRQEKISFLDIRIRTDDEVILQF